MQSCRQRIIFSTMIILTAAVLSLLLPGCSKPPASMPEEPPESVEEVIKEEKEKEITVKIEKIAPVSVVIDNYPFARPQSGLQQASFVYEFLVEGGITRFLAVYDTPFAEDYIIGPVRSLRPYFAVQALEHGGAIAHSGYSQRTAGMIRGLGIKQISSYNYFKRDNSRRAPHNLYTSAEKLHKGAGNDTSKVKNEIITLKDLPESYLEAREIEIIYNRSNVVTYTYDAERGVYLRFINNNPHLDRETQEQYSTRRVIIRYTPHRNVPGPEGLVDIDLEGEGEGFLYEGGKKYAISWKKEKGGATGYFYSEGTPVDTRWGNTWIQVVRKE